jgi:hypothetical protein
MIETITTTTEKFNKVKSRLDGYMFWRETEKGILNIQQKHINK